MQTNKPIGILGGTFDPIHYGHLRSALELYQQLDLQEIRFIPCQQPIFDKTAQATPSQRLAMLKVAITDQPHFVIDERELKRKTPSYMVDTLISLQQEFMQTPLCLIIGSDVLSNLDRWHRWQELIKLCHLIVITRPEYDLPQQGPVAELVKKHQIDDPAQLQKQLNGYLIQVKGTLLAISGTLIRQQIVTGSNPRYLLPDPVLQYIRQEKLYCGKF